MLGIMGKVKQANEKAEIDVSYNVYQKEAGGLWNISSLPNSALNNIAYIIVMHNWF